MFIVNAIKEKKLTEAKQKIEESLQDKILIGLNEMKKILGARNSIIESSTGLKNNTLISYANKAQGSNFTSLRMSPKDKKEKTKRNLRTKYIGLAQKKHRDNISKGKE